MFKPMHAVATLAVASAVAAPAMGATVSFVAPSSDASGSPSYTVVTSDFTVTATGFASNGNPTSTSFSPTPALVSRTTYGLGVNSSAEDVPDRERNIDGRGVDEFLRLVFSGPVRLEGFTLSDLESDDRYTLFVRSGATYAPVSTPAISVASSGSTQTFTGLSIIGSDFLFGVPAGSNSAYDYALAGLTATPVPSPAAAMGGLGLLGLVAGRRARR